MYKQILPAFLAVILIAATTSCNAQGGFKKTKTGLQYKIVKDEPSTRKTDIGDVMTFHITTIVNMNGKDTEVFNSRKMNNNQPVPFQCQKAAFNGDLTEGFQMLSTGDSAIFKVSVDSMLKAGNQMPPEFKKGKNQFLEYRVNVVSVKSKAEAEAKAKNALQGGTDDKILTDYFAKNNIKATKTPSGLYYSITGEGTGAYPKAGQKVTVNYTGKTLDGKTFDSNMDSNFHHVEPFTFGLGQHQVIAGWDEGIALIKKGGKGTLYIPSPLAYGAQSPSPAIPANSCLIFNVEVKDILDK